MSIQTNINLLNANDPEYIKATTTSPEALEEWEDENGPISEQPGAVMDDSNNEWLEETDEEYGGWLIEIAKLPPAATHIHIFRS